MVDDGPAAERPPAAILLLSDGETTTGRDPSDVAREARSVGDPDPHGRARNRGATIRTPTGALVPVPPDPETMREIAELSGGRAFQADDADDLSRIYEDLGSRVATKKEEREITVGLRGRRRVLLAGGRGGLRRGCAYGPRPLLSGGG